MARASPKDDAFNQLLNQAYSAYEALVLATRGPMRLREADLRLEQARLFQAQHQLPKARAALAQAKALVAQTGYARRSAEVDQLGATIN